MSSLMLSSLPSLLLPQRLTPLKKRKLRKSRRAGQAPRAADEEAETKTAEAKDSKAAGYQVNGSPQSGASTNSTDATPKTMGARLLKSMKFRGGAPELINGRCAMIAIPTVMAYEMSQKEQFLQLIADHKFLFAGVIGLISVASLVPIALGAKTESFGFMTREAELINGRAAMIGILSILILEAKSGTNFF